MTGFWKSIGLSKIGGFGHLHTNLGIWSPAVLFSSHYIPRRTSAENVSIHGGRRLSIDSGGISDRFPQVGHRVCADGRWLSRATETVVRLGRLEDGRHRVWHHIALCVMKCGGLMIVAVALIQRLIVRGVVVPEVWRHRVIIRFHHLCCRSLVAVCTTTEVNSQQHPINPTHISV